MGRRKNPIPAQRARISLSFDLKDPIQRHVYAYLSKNRGNVTRIVVSALLAENEDSREQDKKWSPIQKENEPARRNLASPAFIKSDENEIKFPGPLVEPTKTSDSDLQESDMEGLEDMLDAFGDA